MGCKFDFELIVFYMWLLVFYLNCYELFKCDEGFIVLVYNVQVNKIRCNYIFDCLIGIYYQEVQRDIVKFLFVWENLLYFQLIKFLLFDGWIRIV